MAVQTIQRKKLLNALLGSHTTTSVGVTSVDVREIRFEPGQQNGRHLHPCPVFGYIAQGAASLHIEGQPAQALPTGSAFYEPANTVIASFDNASATEPMLFIAFYLLDGNQDLIQML